MPNNTKGRPTAAGLNKLSCSASGESLQHAHYYNICTGPDQSAGTTQILTHNLEVLISLDMDKLCRRAQS